MQKVALIPGDGVGPEVMTQATKLLEAVNKAYSLDFETVTFDLSADHFLETGIALPEGVIATLRDEMDAVLLGPLGDPRIADDRHAREVLRGLTSELDLSVGMRRVRLLSADLCPLSGKTEQDIDLVLVWEATGGIYTEVGGTLDKGSEHEVVIEQEVTTRLRVERVIRFAFDYAARNDLSSVTLGRKSKNYPHGYDLWNRTFREVKADFPGVSASQLRFETLIQMMLDAPENFDVLVTNHLFGSILSALGTALQGGQGLVASSILSPGKMGLFRPLHPSLTRYAGKDYANPIAAMTCVQALMEFAGKAEISHAVELSIKKALKSGWVTRDLGGSMGTSEVGDYVCSALMDNAS
ncbi:MAG: isocitrate/isopropylmalate family dehydrogenase [Candidatus Neomarinimicrobiota bacterium]